MPDDAFAGYEAVPDLPFSPEGERAVLGACLLDENAINDAIEKLIAEDFYLQSHQRIFRCISELAETGKVDSLLVCEELKRARYLDSVGGMGYILDLEGGIPRGFNVQAYCGIIKEKSVLRQLIGISHDVGIRAGDQAESAAEILDDLEERILGLSHAGQQSGFSTILDSAKEAGGIDHFIEKICDPAQMTGLSTGYTDIDKVWGGMKKQELIVVAARPAQGKTALGLCIAANVVTSDSSAVVALFSLEMGRESLYKRLLASQAEVSVRKALEGWLSWDERSRLNSALMRIGDRHLHIDDSSAITVTQMRAKSRRLKQQMGRLDLIEVDYLQLIHGNKRYGNRQEEVASISRGLKALAKELDVPVVALAQVGRGSEQRTGNKRPMLSDLRESGQIEQDADIVAFIHREEYYAGEDDEDVERGTAEIITAKNRDGSTGTRKLVYMAEITKFANLAVR